MIPVCMPDLGTEERDFVIDCIDTNWISSKGKYVSEFEEEFAAYCGCRYGVSTMNGTTALHLALAVLGIGPGDEVIIPSFTMIATANAVVYCGATPIPVDAEPDTWNPDASLIEDAITARTKAILPVHIYGHPCDMDPILDLARDHGLFVVEDAAEAHGAEYRGQRAGGIGDIGCFSFYANKIITCGEGGMIVTDDSDVAERAQDLKNLCFPRDRRTYLHEHVGYNYRMTNIQAAIGLAQFHRIGELVEKRRRNAARYSAALASVPGITLPVERDWAKNVYWMYSILVGDGAGISRDALMDSLAESGIETRPFFTPMHLQPAFRDNARTSGARCPVSEMLSERGLNLPSGSNLTATEIDFICTTISDLIIKRR